MLISTENSTVVGQEGIYDDEGNGYYSAKIADINDSYSGYHVYKDYLYEIIYYEESEELEVS